MQRDPSSADRAWKLERRCLEASGLETVLERLLNCAIDLGGGAVEAATVALADSQHELRHLLAARREPNPDRARSFSSIRCMR